ncbi:Type I restriction-modification system, restriction subunit R [hydrothermal vent metagenome]|uniref:type I site-specific deoxyribonuclease n=1 Tax=hydrothermal vent metagenome TaxID=652676 RepID=A0A3B0X1M9_9ZZZZ
MLLRTVNNINRSESGETWLTDSQLEQLYNDFIDFDNWEANEFIAINQFRLDTPGGVKEFIIPDVVLFVNGLSMVVIECKEASGYASDPMEKLKHGVEYMA